MRTSLLRSASNLPHLSRAQTFARLREDPEQLDFSSSCLVLCPTTASGNYRTKYVTLEKLYELYTTRSSEPRYFCWAPDTPVVPFFVCPSRDACRSVCDSMAVWQQVVGARRGYDTPLTPYVSFQGDTHWQVVLRGLCFESVTAFVAFIRNEVDISPDCYDYSAYSGEAAAVPILGSGQWEPTEPVLTPEAGDASYNIFLEHCPTYILVTDELYQPPDVPEPAHEAPVPPGLQRVDAWERLFPHADLLLSELQRHTGYRTRISRVMRNDKGYLWIYFAEASNGEEYKFGYYVPDQALTIRSRPIGGDHDSRSPIYIEFEDAITAFIRYLPSVAREGLDRIDFPLTEEEWGVRGMVPTGVVFHPENLDTTATRFNMAIWNRLLEQGDDVAMVTYFNLFVNWEQATLSYRIRTRPGMKFGKLARGDSNSGGALFGSLKHTTVTVGPRGKRIEKTVPFFSFWKQHPRARVFLESRTGVFSIFREEGMPPPPLNSLPGVALDLVEARTLYEDWAQGNTEQRKRVEMVEFAWRSYLDLLVFNEKPEWQAGNRAFLERTIWLYIFQVGLKLHYGLVLCSEEGGTGKTTLLELLGVILGRSLCNRCSLDDLATYTFQDHRCALFAVDEAEGDVDDVALINAVKRLVTCFATQSESKFADREVHDAVANILITGNWGHKGKVIPGIQANDRRWFGVEPANTQQRDSYFRDHQYVCRDCADYLDDEGVCRVHSLTDGPSLFAFINDCMVEQSRSTPTSWLKLLVGMWAVHYSEWVESGQAPHRMQSVLPMCKVVEQHKAKARTGAVELLQRWSDRKYHVCPWTADMQNFPEGKQFLFCETLDPNEGLNDGAAAPRWEEWIPEETLYALFRQEYAAAGHRTIPTQRQMVDQIVNFQVAHDPGILTRAEAFKSLRPCLAYKFGWDIDANRQLWKRVPTRATQKPCIRLVRLRAAAEPAARPRSRLNIAALMACDPMEPPRKRPSLAVRPAPPAEAEEVAPDYFEASLSISDEEGINCDN